MKEIGSGANLQAPITTYYHRLKALLEADEDIAVSLDYDGNTITVLVHNPVKAAAWREMLPENKEYNGSEFTINVINDVHGVSNDTFNIAMADNPNFSRLHLTAAGFLYCYMKPAIIQFQNDNLGSPEMNETWTAEDLAREVIPEPTLNYCTDVIG